MKIVQLCPYAMDRPGGVQRHVRDLAHWLTEAGHETRIVAPPAPGRAPRQAGALTELGGARTLAVHGTAFEIGRARARDIRAAAAELRGWGADLVHMHTPWTPLLVGQMARALDLPAVVTVHATLPDPAAKGLVDRYIRWSARRLLPRARAVVVPSEAPLPLVRSFCPGQDIRILPPTIDLSPWFAARATRQSKGLSLLFLGRLEPRKGLDIALNAWPGIAAALPHAHLTIAGDGPLRPLAKAARSGRVTLTGRPDDAEARRLMAAADLLLAPAPYGESFGLILTEALAAGTLPVAAANPGYASVMTGPGTALLTPPGDAGALADKVIALADARIRVPLCAWAAHHARGFDVAEQGPRYIDLFRQALRTG